MTTKKLIVEIKVNFDSDRFIADLLSIVESSEEPFPLTNEDIQQFLEDYGIDLSYYCQFYHKIV